MRHEPVPQGALSRGGARFLRQILDQAGPDWVVERAGERPWASATFDGLRLCIMLRSAAPAKNDAAAALCALLEPADYGVGRYLVADIAAREADGNVRIEALLIQQA